MLKSSSIPIHLNRLCSPVLFISLPFILLGCPYSSPYKLDKEPTIETDERLLGKWSASILTRNGKKESVTMLLNKKNEREYDICFTGYLRDLKPYRVITADTIKGSAYTSEVNNRQFLNIEVKGQTYISELIYKNNKLSILPLAEKFTAKYILSGEELRMAVEVHFKTRIWPVYDEPFCLKEMVKAD